MRASLLTLTLCLFVLPTHAKYSGGTGEPSDPYHIATAADLIALGETPADYAKHFILTADIDLDPNLPGRKVFDKAVIAPDVNEVSVEFQGASFTGVFGGNGHTISHLMIQGKDYLGLFGYLGIGGEVKDLGVTKVSVSGSRDYVGGLAGANVGIVVNCYSTGKLTATAIGGDAVGGLVGGNFIRIANCRSEATVIAINTRDVGGLVGLNMGNIVDSSYSTGTVSGKENVGGIAGSNSLLMSRCFSTGAVMAAGDEGFAGGLAGTNTLGTTGYGSLVNCYGAGPVTGKGVAGGLVGLNVGSVVNCYSTGPVKGEGTSGGLVGDCGSGLGSCSNSFWHKQTSGCIWSACGTGLTNDEMKRQSSFTGWDFVGEVKNGTSEIWQMPQGGGYPVLSILNGYHPLQQLKGRGTPDDPYLLSTAADLGVVCYAPMSCYRLVVDIDLPGITWSTAVIPEFWGTFDGNHFAIRNLRITGGGVLGLFGWLAGPMQVKDFGISRIKDLCIVDVSVAGSGVCVGGLAGESFGPVVNCYCRGTVSAADTSITVVGGLVGVGHIGSVVVDCNSTATVTGKYIAGGVVGNNSGSVVSSYTRGTVAGEGSVGGLVGYNCGLVDGGGGSVVNCCSSATVSCGAIAVAGEGNSCCGGLVGGNRKGSLVNCYSTGPVTGKGYVGGLLGANLDYGNVSNCYSTSRVSGNGANVGGLVGFSLSPSDGGSPFGGSMGFDFPPLCSCSSSFWDKQTSGCTWSAGGTGLTTDEMKRQSSFTGWDFVGEVKNGTSEIWQMPQGGGYPELSILNGYHPLQQLKGKGTADDPYVVSTPQELGAVCYAPMSCYRLGADNDLSGITWSTPPIPAFAAIFDGNGCMIRHLKIRGGGHLGLFGSARVIKDVGVPDADVVGEGYCIGGLIGTNFGTVSCCYTAGTVSGQGIVGGLVGGNYCYVDNCHSAAKVTALVIVGGLIGENTNSVDKCYSTGRVSATLLASFFPPGFSPPPGLPLPCSLVPGGLIGNDGSPFLQLTGCLGGTGAAPNSFWDIETSGCKRSAGGIGLPTVLMTDIDTYLSAGWDIVEAKAKGPEHIWWINEGKDYPRLWWEAHN